MLCGDVSASRCSDAMAGLQLLFTASFSQHSRASMYCPSTLSACGWQWTCGRRLFFIWQITESSSPKVSWLNLDSPPVTDVKMRGIWIQNLPWTGWRVRGSILPRKTGMGTEVCGVCSTPARVCSISTHPWQYFPTGTWDGTLGLSNYTLSLYYNT